MNTPSPELVDKLPPQVLDRLQLAQNNLATALLARDKDIPTHLSEIHRLLITYPETTLLLDDDEILTLIKAQEHHTQVVIVAETVKGKGGGKRTKISVDDL